MYSINSLKKLVVLSVTAPGKLPITSPDVVPDGVNAEPSAVNEEIVVVLVGVPFPTKSKYRALILPLEMVSTVTLSIVAKAVFTKPKLNTVMQKL